jgi:hypothetical protein
MDIAIYFYPRSGTPEPFQKVAKRLREASKASLAATQQAR